MYKCGFQGCEKAYGTLNHLNAHVTMQSHGPKRTPEGMFHQDHSIFWRASSRKRLAASRRDAVLGNPWLSPPWEHHFSRVGMFH